MKKVFIGIDIAKDKIDIHVRPSGESWTASTTPADLSTTAARLAALGPTIIVMEATGGYETRLAASLATSELPVAIIITPVVKYQKVKPIGQLTHKQQITY